MASVDLAPSSDVNDFLTELAPEYNWSIPDVIEVGDRVIFTGREGRGKSTLLRQIGIQAAMGVHPFTLDPMEPRRVAFFDLENPRGLLRREVERIKANRPIDPGYLSITSLPGGMDLSHVETANAMTRRLDELQPEIVIIGPMYKMFPGLETEESSSKLAFLLDMWRMNYKFALIMESHQPHSTVVEGKVHRPERPFGSSLWMRWPEFGMCLEDEGVLRPWRGARDESREWPTKLRRGDEWLWEIDCLRCLKCGNPLTGKQKRYCSENCGAAARMSKSRATGPQMRYEQTVT